MVTPPGMVSRFWAPMAFMGMGQCISSASIKLQDEGKCFRRGWGPEVA